MYLIIALSIQAASPESGGPILVMGNVQPEPVKEKKICRAGAATGTRVTKNICKTQAEWDALQSRYFNKTDHLFNNGLGGVN